MNTRIIRVISSCVDRFMREIELNSSCPKTRTNDGRDAFLSICRTYQKEIDKCAWNLDQPPTGSVGTHIRAAAIVFKAVERPHPFEQPEQNARMAFFMAMGFLKALDPVYRGLIHRDVAMTNLYQCLTEMIHGRRSLQSYLDMMSALYCALDLQRLE